MTTSTTLPAVGLEVPPLWSIDEPAWFILEPPHAVATTVTTRSPRAVLIRTGFDLSRCVVGVDFKNGCRCDPGDVRLAAAVRAPFGSSGSDPAMQLVHEGEDGTGTSRHHPMRGWILHAAGH